MKTYNEIRHHLKTGDLVFFSGKGFVSNMIKLVTRSKWSHVGIVLNHIEFDHVMLWESTTLSNIPDSETHQKTKGVQLVTLSNRLEVYDGDVMIKRLNRPVQDANLILARLRKEFKNVDYEQSELELVKSALDLTNLDKNEEDFSSIFCSELVAKAYKELGLFPGDIVSNEWTPADFARVSNLLNGYNLSDDILLSIRP